MRFPFALIAAAASALIATTEGIEEQTRGEGAGTDAQPSSATPEKRVAGIKRLRNHKNPNSRSQAAPACTLEFELCRADKPSNFTAMRDCLLNKHRDELSAECLQYLEISDRCPLPLLHEICHGEPAANLAACLQEIRRNESSSHAGQLALLSKECWIILNRASSSRNSQRSDL